MANLAVLDVWEVKTYCFNAARNQLGINVNHFEVSTVGTPPATDQDFANQWDTVMNFWLKNCLAADCLYYGASVQRVLPLPRTPLAFTTASQGAGLDAGVSLPNQVTGLVTFLTGSAGRAYRGRNYMPFPSASEEQPEVPKVAYVAAVQNYGNAVVNFHTVAGMGAALVQHVIRHRSGSAPTNTTAALARRKWATQRRRGDYGRPNSVPF